RFVLLCGDAGIGKTRLAAEFACELHRQGALTFHGSCDEEPLAPHQPFVEALSHYVHVASPAELRSRVAEVGRPLACLVPKLADFVPALTPPEPVGDGQRYAMFEAVAGLLGRLSTVAPILLVVDDLHWADKSTTTLLGYLLRSDRRCRLLVVGTYRENELLAPGHLATALSGLGPGPDRVRLARLDDEEVGELARHWGAPGEALVSIQARTEGNPLFVQEMVRHLAESGDRLQGLGVPDRVKDLIGRRLARLSDECSRLLRIAAVAGREFDLELLERMSELPSERLAEVLEEAVGAGVLVELPHFDRFGFSHALIRETLAEGITRTRRARLHARVAETLGELHDGDLESILPELAHHYGCAGRAGDLDKAVEFAVRGGDQAKSKHAYAEAVELYTQALALLPDHDRRRRPIALTRAVTYQALTHLLLDRPTVEAAGTSKEARPG
ncbi:MAG: AAA family ATPase, partial [Actinomycetota bacterium]|nr:AAA family ATPase [Actinomycetota bacterium]